MFEFGVMLKDAILDHTAGWTTRAGITLALAVTRDFLPECGSFLRTRGYLFDVKGLPPTGS